MTVKEKKERKHALGQESKFQEKSVTVTMKKKEGRKWKTQIEINISRYIQFGRTDK